MIEGENYLHTSSLLLSVLDNYKTDLISSNLRLIDFPIWY